MKNSILSRALYSRNGISLYLLVFLALSIVDSMNAQDPLWVVGNQEVTFNEDPSYNPFQSTSSLPVIAPGDYESDNGDPRFYYQGGPPSVHQNAQYDEDGELLFFVQDGNIYDSDGHAISIAAFIFSREYNSAGDNYKVLVEDNEELDGNICDHCLEKFNNPDVIITPVPFSCDKYYVIYAHSPILHDENDGGVVAENSSYNYTNSSDTWWSQLGYQILDLGADNIHFENPDIKGAVVTSANYPAYAEEFDFDANNDDHVSSFLAQDELDDIPGANQMPFFHMELLDLSPAGTNGLKKLYVSTGMSIVTIDILENEVSVSADVVTSSPCDGVADAPSAGQKIVLGDLQVAYCKNLNSYVLANTSHPNTGIHHTYLNLYKLSPSGVIGDLIHCEEMEDRDIVGLNFSPNGNYLYSNISARNNGATSELMCLEIGADEQVNDVSLASFSQATYVTSGYNRSRIEENYYEGQKALFVKGSSGIGILKNSNTPDFLTLENIAVDTEVEVPESWLFMAFSPVQTDGIQEADLEAFKFGIFPKQNVNGKSHLDFLATADCCEPILGIDGVGDTQINESATWTSINPFDPGSTTIKVSGTITITAGTNITIQDMTFEFGPEGKVVVEAGARLYLRSSTLTSHCNLMWPGVVVQGNSSLPQTPMINQGYLYMLSSVIENAYTGIEVKSGGRLNCNRSDFKNNEKGVWIKPYSHWGDNRFYDCEFITDMALLYEAKEPRVHLDLSEVRNVRVINTSFLNTAPTSIYNINHRGVGIRALNSRFYVTDSNTDGEEDQFFKLTHGVLAINGTSLNTFNIQDMSFLDNRSGITAISQTNSFIKSNYFRVPSNVYVSGDVNRIPEGCHLSGSTGYTVEENVFRHLWSDIRTNGLIVDNSGAAENEVYRNWFRGFGTGVYVKNNNRGEIDQQAQGLQVRCESFSDNRFDIYLNSNSEWRDVQGDISDVDGLTHNYFSDDIHDCPTWYKDILVSSGYAGPEFDYLHLNNDYTAPDCASAHMNAFVPGAYTFETFDFASNCPSNFGNGGDHFSGDRDPKEIKSKSDEELLSQHRHLSKYLDSQREYLTRYSASSEEASRLMTELSSLSLKKAKIEKELTLRYLHPELLDEDTEELPDYEAYYGLLADINEEWAYKILGTKAIREGEERNLESIERRLADSNPELISWWNLSKSIKSSGGQLSETQETELWSIYEAEGKSYSDALAMLHLHGVTDIIPEIAEPEVASNEKAKEPIESEVLSIFPNPAMDFVQFIVDPEVSEDVHLTVLDNQGKVVESLQSTTDTPTRIDVSQYASGIYFVKVWSNRRLLNQGKFAVTRK